MLFGVAVHKSQCSAAQLASHIVAELQLGLGSPPWSAAMQPDSEKSLFPCFVGGGGGEGWGGGDSDAGVAQLVLVWDWVLCKSTGAYVWAQTVKQLGHPAPACHVQLLSVCCIKHKLQEALASAASPGAA